MSPLKAKKCFRQTDRQTGCYYFSGSLGHSLEGGVKHFEKYFGVKRAELVVTYRVIVLSKTLTIRNI